MLIFVNISRGFPSNTHPLRWPDGMWLPEWQYVMPQSARNNAEPGKKHFCINMNGAFCHSANSSTVSLACLWQPVPNKSPLFVLVWAFLLC